jgi:hypothetical protein
MSYSYSFCLSSFALLAICLCMLALKGYLRGEVSDVWSRSSSDYALLIELIAFIAIKIITIFIWYLINLSSFLIPRSANDPLFVIMGRYVVTSSTNGPCCCSTVWFLHFDGCYPSLNLLGLIVPL